MKNRILGKTGYKVSEVGLGCWQLGGDFGPIEDDKAKKILANAQLNHVNFIDTADVYGKGKSETLIGNFFPSKRESNNNVIATKIGRSTDLYPDKYNHKIIEQSIRESAERLQTNSIDLVQLHCIPTSILKNGIIFEIMDSLVKQGLIKHWGSSVETLEEAHICIKQPGCSSLQIIFNLFRQDPVWSLFNEAKARKVGIIARLPFASGILTGKFSTNHQFDESDHRNYNRDGAFFSVGETFSGIEQSKAVELSSLFEDFVPEGWTLSDFALRWILDHEAVSTVITGCSEATQIIQNVSSSKLPSIPMSNHAKLREIYLSDIKPYIRCPV
tara:strand:+ start:465 stop:1451 length:987 start_codon:yes stop_codon:yes gene_type:complete